MNRTLVRRIPASLAPFAAAALVLAMAMLAPATSEAKRFGLQGGFSFSPDQFVAGVHMKLPQIADRVEFMPSAEVGFGDDVTSFALNGDFKYHLIPGKALDPYAGIGATVNWFDGDGNAGANLIGGVHVAHRVFLEGKLGLGDVPDGKLMVGLTF